MATESGPTVPLVSGFQNAKYTSETISGAGTITVRPNLDQSTLVYSLDDATTTAVQVLLPVPQFRGVGDSLSIIYVVLGSNSIDKDITVTFVRPPAISGVSGFPDYNGGNINGAASDLVFTKAAANTNNPYIFFIHSSVTEDYQVRFFPAPPNYLAGDGITFTGENPITMSASTPMTIGEVDFNVDVGGAEYTAAIAVAGTNVDIAPAVNLKTSGSVKFDSPAAGQLRYIGSLTRTYHCAFSFGARLAAGTQERIRIEIYRNGAPFSSGFPSTPRYYSNFLQSASDVQTIAFHALIDLAPNDIISMAVANMDGTNDVIFTALNIVAVGSYEA